jgi:hypothetical protein
LHCQGAFNKERNTTLTSPTKSNTALENHVLFPFLWGQWETSELIPPYLGTNVLKAFGFDFLLLSTKA